MTPVDVQVMEKIGLLGLGLYLENVSKACKMLGVSRQHYYDIKRLYEQGGAEAIREHYAVQSRPGERPGLAAHGGAGRRRGQAQPAQPVESAHSALSGRPGRQGRPDRPGSLLVRQTLHAGYFKGLGPVLQHSVVDAYSRYAFATLACGRQESAWAGFLEREVFAFFSLLGFPVERVITCSGSAASPDRGGRAEDELFTRLGVEHRVLSREGRITQACLRFNAACEKQYLRVRFRAHFQSLAELDAELDRLLTWHNARSAQKGFACLGRTPAATLKSALPVRVLARHAMALGLPGPQRHLPEQPAQPAQPVQPVQQGQTAQSSQAEQPAHSAHSAARPAAGGA